MEVRTDRYRITNFKHQWWEITQHVHPLVTSVYKVATGEGDSYRIESCTPLSIINKTWWTAKVRIGCGTWSRLIGKREWEVSWTGNLLMKRWVLLSNASKGRPASVERARYMIVDRSKRSLQTLYLSARWISSCNRTLLACPYARNKSIRSRGGFWSTRLRYLHRMWRWSRVDTRTDRILLIFRTQTVWICIVTLAVNWCLSMILSTEGHRWLIVYRRTLTPIIVWSTRSKPLGLDI